MFTIFKDGMRLRMRPLTHRVKSTLTPALSYMRKVYLATRWQQEERGSKRNPYFEFSRVACYGVGQFNGYSQLFTNAGYLPLIEQTLRNNGVRYELVDRTPKGNMFFEEPEWNVLEDYEMRPRQEEALRALLAEERGRLTWATGTGKSAMIEMICRLLPKSRIVITTKFNDTLETIHGYIRGSVGCGMYNSRRKAPARRVNCVSIGCLKYALNNLKPQVVICDEVHEVATPKALEDLSYFRYARMFGLSANENDRMDNADFELTGIFGDVVDRLQYEEGVKLDMIVPIEVHWHTVRMKKNPAKNRSSGVPKSRWGIWRNKVRNKAIAQDARCFPKDQVLVVVKTIEHAVYLKQQLPEFTLMYGKMDEGDIEFYVNNGFLPQKYRTMSRQKRTKLRVKFETGKLRKVIATSVWNRGVNFRNLGVLIRADGGSSTIDATQIPGRLSRTSEDGGKKCGVLIDYRDVFDSGLDRRSKMREKDYDKQKWKQVKEGQPGHFRAASEEDAGAAGQPGKARLHPVPKAARSKPDRQRKLLFARS